MATDREISRVRRDTVEWRGLVRRLLHYADEHGLEDRHIGLLESLDTGWRLDELSHRQAEWLLDIRDDTDFVAEFRDCSVKYLLRACYENRYGIDDEDDQVWFDYIYGRGDARLRKRDARRLYFLARSLGEIEDEALTAGSR